MFSKKTDGAPSGFEKKADDRPNETGQSICSFFFFFFCILITFIDFQFYIQFTTLTYYLLHSLTHTYIQAHTHPNNKSTKILKL